MSDISGHEPIVNIESYTDYFLEALFRSVFFWETDPKRLGTIIRILHHSFIYIFAVCFIIIHTIMPSFIGLLILFLVYSLIWLQHIFFGRCIVSNLEQSLLGDSKSFIDPFLDIFHIPITKETTIGITIMGSTLLFGFLGFELSARCVLYIKGLFS